MRLFGHRGASAVRPENTLAAFDFALSQSAVAGVECDLHLLADRQTIIVLHDDTLRRTAECGEEINRQYVGIMDTPVEELLLADLASVDVGSWFAPEFASERIIQITTSSASWQSIIRLACWS